MVQKLLSKALQNFNRNTSILQYHHMMLLNGIVQLEIKQTLLLWLPKQAQGCLDSRLLCLLVQQPGCANCSLVRKNYKSQGHSTCFIYPSSSNTALFSLIHDTDSLIPGPWEEVRSPHCQAHSAHALPFLQ